MADRAWWAVESDAPDRLAMRWGGLDRLDAFLQRHRVTAWPRPPYAKWNDDSAGRLANLVAYSAFLAVFPLLLVLLTLTEVLLVGHKAVQQEVIDAALRQFPEIGSELAGPCERADREETPCSWPW